MMSKKSNIKKTNEVQDNVCKINIEKSEIDDDIIKALKIVKLSDYDTDVIKENDGESIQKKLTLDKLNTHKKKSYKKYIIAFLVILNIIVISITISLPRIKLYGSKHIILNYQDEFIEPGYTGKIFNKDITNSVIVSNEIIPKKVGKYQIKYIIKYHHINIQKKRYVSLVDKKKPVISIEENPINLCPKQDINTINYQAYDEYDGNITNKVILKEDKGKLFLSVLDSSNNLAKLTVDITRTDKKKPVITLKGDQTIYLDSGEVYQEYGYTAVDNCDGDITDRVQVSGNVGTAFSEYQITYTVKDSANNETTINRKVIRRNKELPNSGLKTKGSIYLTFDDGPREDTTKYILDILKEEGVLATFFVTGSGEDYLIKRAYSEGHAIGLHTYTHNYEYIYSSTQNYFEDLNRVSKRVKRITGLDSKIIRFPGGSSNTISRKYKVGIMSELTTMVLNRGYRYYDWNVDGNDAGGALSSQEVYSNVISNLSPNRMNVVLLHDVKDFTKDAIRDIIRYGKKNGYTFKKIDMDTYMIRHGVNN